jgi:hypothetical protein
VLATLYGTPAWANGGKAANVIPRSKSSFAAFALAAAKRYPAIKMWEIWNEPNLRRFLNPNSPTLYLQRLLNPAYAVLHGLRRSNRVAGGATSPRPTPSGLSPVAFMRGMRRAHARLDAYSHHPYPVTPGETPSSFAHGTCRYCKGVLTLANLPLLLREVKRDFGAKRIWLTEYGYQTNPPDRFGVSTARQTQYVSEAALRAKSARYGDGRGQPADQLPRLLPSRGERQPRSPVPGLLADQQGHEPGDHDSLTSTQRFSRAEIRTASVIRAARRPSENVGIPAAAAADPLRMLSYTSATNASKQSAYPCG